MQCWQFADDAEARQRPAPAVMGFRRNRLRRFAAMLPISAALVGTSMEASTG
jgi:hypothetical protein